MKTIKQIVCPISDQKINERVTRINALFALLLVVSSFVFNSVYFLIFLLADFYIRAFTKLKYSPISYASYALSNAFNLSKKPIDKAPKVFAARLGFLMTLIIGLLFFLNFNIAAFLVSGVLVFFASLEFVLGLCVGCIIYTYVVLPFYKGS